MSWQGHQETSLYTLKVASPGPWWSSVVDGSSSTSIQIYDSESLCPHFSIYSSENDVSDPLRSMIRRLPSVM